MSDNNDSNNSDGDKIIGVKLRLSECAHGNMHVTAVAPLRESDVAYSAPDADEVLGGSRVGGGSRLYNANWDRMFGSEQVSDENLN